MTVASVTPPVSSSSSSPSPVAWIAGVGASAGLGAALARRFADEGFIVALTGRTQAQLQAVAGEIEAAGGRAHAFAGDVASEAEIHGIAQRVRALGPLTVAIFNAASAVRAPTLDISVDQFTQAWRTSALGGFVFGREALRGLLANTFEADGAKGRGSLLFTGATAALRGKPPFAAFAAAKASLRSLSQSLAREFGPQGIHVAHVVIDGGIDGERLRNNAPQRVAQAGDDGLLQLEAIAESYWQLHVQHRSAWTQELDLRPFKEPF
ncbi:SDR family NAD(P)-dependent oxidoreductase [Variovorax sp. PAMC26660]|uniref:SDR family NAD(P)-dependent oxidoreductase n=1 Tax=Variovorax sp. PAMC26660 TaxID=2762322 RepID=UPI00164E8D49|nr:SDR family NAD(P)-dependent oxidoreductase [Variovorax sp. PAMC26660]QNK67322.1 SDR family NAD(P)-dependent oxidoreductase [Variovorax sp. PAMC26660]